MLAITMSDRDLARAWHAILGYLEIEVSPHSFTTWLSHTTAARFDDETLVVEARNAMNCEWLNERLIVVVQRAAAAVLGRPVGVRFIPRGSEAERPTGPASQPRPAAPERPPVGAINCGYTSKGLPIGLQIAGKRFDDLGVLQVARAFELVREAQRPWPKPPSEAIHHVD